MLTTDASSQGWGATLIYENQIELILYDCWSGKEIEMEINAKEIKTIHDVLLPFEQAIRKMQDQVIQICSYNITAVYKIVKWKANESLIVRIKHQQVHSRDYADRETICLKMEKFKRSVRDGTIGQRIYPSVEHFLATKKIAKKYKLYIHPPIPALNRILQKIKQDKAHEIIVAPIQTGQSWYTKLKNLSTKFLFLGSQEKILEIETRMKDKNQKFPTVNVGAFLLDLSQTQEDICL
ncbi:MAG: hypothetical protein EZS28_026403 [Streblomastix strix]|uniref:Uncharacterized protein n=1 Tax=Streblomastix strix TaxID=222440 RepID=A0A5J4V643_9EUKA|nr:MAG: hypothetical protein EZS28_026403 [Streblomastix strix]